MEKILESIDENKIQKQKCEHCVESTLFTKVFGDMGIGFEIYRHVDIRQQKAGLPIHQSTYTYILQNNRSTDVATTEILNKLNKYKLNCNRCSTIRSQVCELLKHSPIIKEKITTSVCFDCNKNKSYQFCERCNTALKKFMLYTDPSTYNQTSQSDIDNLATTIEDFHKHIQENRNVTQKSEHGKYVTIQQPEINDIVPCAAVRYSKDLETAFGSRYSRSEINLYDAPKKALSIIKNYDKDKPLTDNKVSPDTSCKMSFDIVGKKLNDNTFSYHFAKRKLMDKTTQPKAILSSSLLLTMTKDKLMQKQREEEEMKRMQAEEERQKELDRLEEEKRKEDEQRLKLEMQEEKKRLKKEGNMEEEEEKKGKKIGKDDTDDDKGKTKGGKKKTKSRKDEDERGGRRSKNEDERGERRRKNDDERGGRRRKDDDERGGRRRKDRTREDDDDERRNKKKDKTKRSDRDTSNEDLKSKGKGGKKKGGKGKYEDDEDWTTEKDETERSRGGKGSKGRHTDDFDDYDDDERDAKRKGKYKSDDERDGQKGGKEKGGKEKGDKEKGGKEKGGKDDIGKGKEKFGAEKNKEHAEDKNKNMHEDRRMKEEYERRTRELEDKRRREDQRRVKEENERKARALQERKKAGDMLGGKDFVTREGDDRIATEDDDRRARRAEERRMKDETRKGRDDEVWGPKKGDGIRPQDVIGKGKGDRDRDLKDIAGKGPEDDYDELKRFDVKEADQAIDVMEFPGVPGLSSAAGHHELGKFGDEIPKKEKIKKKKQVKDIKRLKPTQEEAKELKVTKKDKDEKKPRGKDTETKLDKDDRETKDRKKPDGEGSGKIKIKHKREVKISLSQKEMSSKLSLKKASKLQLKKGTSTETGLSKDTKQLETQKKILGIQNLKDLIKRLSAKKVYSKETMPIEPQDEEIKSAKKKTFLIPKKIKSPVKHGTDEQKVISHVSTDEINSDEKRYQAEKLSPEIEYIFKEDIVELKPQISRHDSILQVLEDKGFVSKTLTKGQSAGRQIIGGTRDAEWMHDEQGVKQPEVPVAKVKEGVESDKGVLHYALSDLKYIYNGITQLPTDKIVKKMNIYRMSFVKPELNWFYRNNHRRLVLYKTGEKLGEINDDDTGGKWFYRNGEVALEYKKTKDPDGVTHSRFVVYSRSEEDPLGNKRPVTILASFDDQGNGIVFDHVGKARLKYNQSEGVLLDTTLGPETHWIWHSLNEPPVLQQIMIDTELLIKDPVIAMYDGYEPAKTRGPSKDESLIAIEYENFVKQKTTISKPYVPYKIRMKALKINEHFSLRVVQQACIHLSFRDGNLNLKLNLGMELDNTEIIDVKTSELGDVLNPIDCLPATSESIANLQAHLFEVKAKERQRVNRDRSLNPKIVFSADKFEPFITHPLRTRYRPKSKSLTCICDYDYLAKDLKSDYLNFALGNT